MTTPSWQLKVPLDAMIFDCDGTLSSIEGIDELAKNTGVSEEVQSLTEQAMGHVGITPELYQKRLDLVRPSKEQVLALGKQYCIHQTPDADTIIKVLKRLNKVIYLISAGLSPAVSYFGQHLQIPQENIFAVNISFDAGGAYVDYERKSPLVNNDGKRRIIRQLQKIHRHIHYVGDGLNDWAVADLVSRFIGYGGAFYRENIATRCEFYIRSQSLAPLLPLSLTEQEFHALQQQEESSLDPAHSRGTALYQKGLRVMAEGEVMFSRDELT